MKLDKAAACDEGKHQLLKEAVAAADLGLMLGKGYEIQLTRAASLITALLGHGKNPPRVFPVARFVLIFSINFELNDLFPILVHKG